MDYVILDWREASLVFGHYFSLKKFLRNNRLQLLTSILIDSNFLVTQKTADP
jgi:hypothetical protein